MPEAHGWFTGTKLLIDLIEHRGICWPRSPKIMELEQNTLASVTGMFGGQPHRWLGGKLGKLFLSPQIYSENLKQVTPCFWRWKAAKYHCCPWRRRGIQWVRYHRNLCISCALWDLGAARVEDILWLLRFCLFKQVLDYMISCANGIAMHSFELYHCISMHLLQLLHILCYVFLCKI